MVPSALPVVASTTPSDLSTLIPSVEHSVASSAPSCLPIITSFVQPSANPFVAPTAPSIPSTLVPTVQPSANLFVIESGQPITTVTFSFYPSISLHPSCSPNIADGSSNSKLSFTLQLLSLINFTIGIAVVFSITLSTFFFSP